MDNLKKFFEAVDVMVRMTEDGQLTHEDHRRCYMSNQHWLREMSTVSLTVPRQVGKTSYINKRATCADIVIVHNHSMKDMYRGSRATVVTVHELAGFNRGRSQRGFNRVYVDEPRMVFDRRFSLDELYSMFSGEHGSALCANMFVLLGT